jgi:hypothetical protein
MSTSISREKVVRGQAHDSSELGLLGDDGVVDIPVV